MLVYLDGNDGNRKATSPRPSPQSGEGEVLRALVLLHGLEDTAASDYMPHIADWSPGWVRTV